MSENWAENAPQLPVGPRLEGVPPSSHGTSTVPVIRFKIIIRNRGNRCRLERVGKPKWKSRTRFVSQEGAK